MAGDFQPDRGMDGLLKRALPDRAAGQGPCIEPEQFAAWIDGALSAEEARAVELHLSNCARCQAMAAAFDASEAAPVSAPATVTPITSKRPIRWVVPAAAGTIAASLLVWVATRDVLAPETQMARSPDAIESRPSPSSPEGGARPPLSDLKKEQPETKQLGASQSAPAQQEKESRVDVLRPAAAPGEAPKMVRTEPPSAAPVAPPKPTPVTPATSVAGGLAQSPPPAIVAPSPTPAPARQATVSGLPQSSINITLDGVSISDPRRSTETFFAMGPVAEFSSPSSPRQDAIEAVTLKPPAAADTMAVFRSGAGGGGGRGGAGAAAGRGGAATAGGVAGGIPAEGRGAIEGSIQDAGGGVIPGATVQARALGGTMTSTATTDNLGNYRFTALAPGTYTVTAILQGFVTQTVDDVVVETGKTTRANATLTVGALTETVSVQSASSVRDLLDKQRATRWRIFSQNIVHRSNDGVNWTTVQLEAGLPEVSTGAAPAPTVCWLVGRAGLVLVTSNATMFKRVATPANVDLVAVQAINALRATVTAADGRKFTTADGGLTWK